MFGIKFTIGAVDKTAKTTDDIGRKLRRFGSKINSLINLGGLVMAFRKVGSAIDSAFQTSTYVKEWDSFKEKMSTGFGEVAGRIADAWGPMLDQAGEWGDKILGVFNKVVQKVQWIGAFLGAVFAGEGFSEAKKQADEIVSAMEEEYQARKKVQDAAKAAEEAAKAEGEAKDKAAKAESERQKKIADGRKNVERYMEMDFTREEMRAEEAEKAKQEAERAAEDKKDADEKAAKEAQQKKKQREDAAEKEAERRVKAQIEKLEAAAESKKASFARRAPLGTFASGMSEMDTDDLKNVAMGPLSGVSAISKAARTSLKKQRKWNRLVAEAERRSQHGGRLSKRMQAVLEVDRREKAEKEAAKLEAAAAQAQIDMEKNIAAIKDELVGSGIGTTATGGM